MYIIVYIYIMYSIYHMDPYGITIQLKYPGS